MKIDSKKMLEMYKSNKQLNLTRGQVFLVYRLNKDEKEVGGMFAAPYTIKRTKIIQGIQPTPVMKYQLTSDKSFKNVRNDGEKGFKITSALRGAGKADNQGGGHAEEYFLQFFLAKRNLIKITNVELMISRIPCVGISPAWRLAHPEADLPLGCGAKLREVIKRNSKVNWTIAYEDLANMDFSDMYEINKLTNASSGSLYAMVHGW